MVNSKDLEFLRTEVESLRGGSGLNIDRRSVLKGATLGGFALAAAPVLAQAVTTPDVGLDVGRVLVNVGDDDMYAYRAKPKNKSNPSVLLVISEIFGVHAYIEDVCRRFAQAGFYAIAPELFFRQGDPGQYPTIAEIQEKVIAKVDDRQVLKDLDSCVEFARKEGANTVNLAVTGFCWGGRQTWLYVAHQPAVKAGVAWYGRVVGNRTELTPRQPVDVAGDLKAPVLGLYGAADKGIPLDTVEQMRQALKTAAATNSFARESTIEVFENAQHAFHADYRPSYDAAIAKQAYNQALQFFRSRGLI